MVRYHATMMDASQSRRAHVRRNLFVVASIASPGVSAPVRVRNLSDLGALVEGPELPGIGERITLRRGDLTASGKVVRKIADRAGLQFDRPIQVAAWLPSGVRDQAAVNAQVAEARASSTGGHQGACPNPVPQTVPMREELESVADMLVALADAFSEDPAIVERYLTRLQVLDVAAQKIRYFARR
ncbi:PilZ domain-containing protein [Qipengyuania sp. RANM35]|uniref:PilZ domain-containing protein n=1 Tax=Qipengyuania sp. RANM35 TaxID=3068635 RepID=UPI0034DB7459